jgi:hypothetical protein
VKSRVSTRVTSSEICGGRNDTSCSASSRDHECCVASLPHDVCDSPD